MVVHLSHDTLTARAFTCSIDQLSRASSESLSIKTFHSTPEVLSGPSHNHCCADSSSSRWTLFFFDESMNFVNGFQSRWESRKTSSRSSHTFLAKKESLNESIDLLPNKVRRVENFCKQHSEDRIKRLRRLLLSISTHCRYSEGLGPMTIKTFMKSSRPHLCVDISEGDFVFISIKRNQQKTKSLSTSIWIETDTTWLKDDENYFRQSDEASLNRAESVFILVCEYAVGDRRRQNLN